jgi:hypothetical protein
MVVAAREALSAKLSGMMILVDSPAVLMALDREGTKESNCAAVHSADS